VLPLEVSVLQQPASGRVCPTTASPALDVYFLQQAGLPRRVFPIAACGALGRVSFTASCDALTCLSYSSLCCLLMFLFSSCCRPDNARGDSSRTADCYRDTSRVSTGCYRTVHPGHRVGRVLSLFSSHRNWDSPIPLGAGECAPSPLVRGGGRAH
jgi:hypothetical protein